MEKEIIIQWKKVIQTCEGKFIGYSKLLNPPATKEDIKKIETKMSFTLPDDLVEIYLSNNGDSERLLGTLLGLPFLSLDEMFVQWNTWNEIINLEGEETMEDLSSLCTSNPKNTIKILYANKKWIPIGHDYSGNHIGIDLDPDVSGKVGQVINFGRDEDNKFVIADSLLDFLKILEKLIQDNQFEIKLDEKDSNRVLCGWKENIHPIDSLIGLIKEKNL